MDGLLAPLAIATGLGLLVGLQRQYADQGIAGIRTFPLVTVLGVIAAVLSDGGSGWALGAGLVAVTMLLIIGNVIQLQQGQGREGLTTEFAALVMYGVGALLAYGYVLPSVVVGGGVAVLLQAKSDMHRMADRVGTAEATAIFRFALLALVIWPILPNEGYGPFEVLNPFRIWGMVVLIVGISLAGWIAFRLLGPRAGTLAAGVLGGLISSTATTVSYARRDSEGPTRPRATALVIGIASTVVFGRVLFEMAAVAPDLIWETAPPLALQGLGVALLCFGLHRIARSEVAAAPPDPEPPSDLKTPIVFGLLYAGILLVVAWAQESLGTGALYGIAVLSGLTDMDAITLSTMELSRAGGLETGTAWRVILIASMSNLAFKGGVVVAVGGRALARWTVSLFALAIAVGGAILVLWPG